MHLVTRWYFVLMPYRGCGHLPPAEVEALGRTAGSNEAVDVDALERLQALGFDRGLAAQALLQVQQHPHTKEHPFRLLLFAKQNIIRTVCVQ